MTRARPTAAARGTLLTTVLGSLLGSTVMGGAFSQAAQAQEVIEGGGSETVIGGGGGTQPSPWNVGADLTIGDNGTGELIITDGGGVASTTGRVSMGDAGTVTVDGLNSTWDLLNSPLYVGVIGTGTLNITDGAIVENASAYMGDEPGSFGIVNVDGANATWANSGGLVVGSRGNATLNIRNTGDVTNTTSRIGDREGSVGSVLVDGAGSTWTSTGSIYIGDQGSGTLTVTNQGAVVSNSAIIGASEAGNGQASVDRGTWNIVSSLDVGNDGEGRLDISGGGAVANGNAIVGSAATSSGIVNVSDLGSVWSSSLLIIGESGIGEVSITNGGTVSSAVGVLGLESDGSGIVTVNGATWNNGTNLRVGNSGSGTLNISDGGSVNSSASFVAAAAGGTGEVTIDGAGSNWTTSGNHSIGWQGDGTLTLSDDGRITAGSGLVTLANAAGATGTLNIGAGAAAGIVDANTVDGRAGTAVINFNHDNGEYFFTGDGTVAGTNITITGSTAVNQIGTGTTVLRGTNSYSGGTTVTNGTLRNTGVVGDVLVNGGTFGGDGTADMVTVNSGGTLAPGNSIGVMTAASAEFGAGSFLDVELNDGGNTAGINNDLLNVAGTVTINGGTVSVTPENGSDDGTTYSPNTVYTIITAGSGVNGTFDSGTPTDDYAFLDFGLNYDANNVYLTSLVPVTSFCLSEATPNQCATGDGVFTLGAGGLFTAVLNLSDEEAGAALDVLSGENHASTRTALVEDSRFPREAALDRARTAVRAVAAGGQPPAHRRISDSLAFWGEGFGSWANWNGDRNTAELDRSIGGFFLGADAEVHQDFRLGVFGGHDSARFKLNRRSSSASADTAHLGVYGGAEFGKLGLRFGSSYAWHDIGTVRSVAFTGFSETLSSSYKARTSQVFGEAGYRFDYGTARLEPFARLAYVRLSTDGYSESGGEAALTASRRSAETTYSAIGLRAENGFDFGGAPAKLSGSAAWRRAFGDKTPITTHAFAGGENFSITGAPLARDVLTLVLGGSVTVTPNTTLGLSYSGQFDSRFSDQGLRANFALRF